MVLLASLLSFMVISIFELIWIQINVSFQFTFFILNFQSFSLHIGEGMGELSLADRATIANMSPEYGATMGFFPVDRSGPRCLANIIEELWVHIKDLVFHSCSSQDFYS